MSLFRRRNARRKRSAVLSRSRRKLFRSREGRTRQFPWKRIVWSSVGVAVGALVAYGAYMIFFSELLKIRNVLVFRDDIGVEHSLAAEMHELLSGQHLLLFSASEVEAFLRERRESYQKLSYQRHFPDSLEVHLTSFPVVARTSYLMDNYLITEDGYLIASSGEENLSLPYISLRTVSTRRTGTHGVVAQFDDLTFAEGLTFEVQERIIDARDLHLMLRLLEVLETEFSLPVLDTEYFRVAREVTVRTADGASILFDLHMPIQEQAHKLRLFLERYSLSGGNIREVDLRIGSDKIFYR